MALVSFEPFFERRSRLMGIRVLVAGAAASVVVLSAVSVAAITGLLPDSSAAKAPRPVVAAQPPACNHCGVVVRVRAVEVKGNGTGLGAVAGGVAGAVVGHEIGNGRDAGTLLGAAGGALAGHEIERHARTTKRYHIEVRMEDGSLRTISTAAPPAWKAGDAVHVRGGKLTAAT
jgi:outer membrane lipoprotein SlyB